MMKNDQSSSSRWLTKGSANDNVGKFYFSFNLYHQVSVRISQPACMPTLTIVIALLCVTWLETHTKWPVPRDLNLTRQYSSVIGQTTSSVRMVVESLQDTKRPSGRLCNLFRTLRVMQL